MHQADPAPTTPPPIAPVADALVVTIYDDTSLADWQALGLLGREWALYHAIRDCYRRIVFLTYGDERDHQITSALDPAPVVVANTRGLAKAAFLDEAPARVLAALGGAKTCVVRTDQIHGGAPALTITRRLRAAGVRTGLVARAGYPRSRFTAWLGAPDSPESVRDFALERDLTRGADAVITTTPTIRDDLAWAHQLRLDRMRVVPNFLGPLPPPRVRGPLGEGHAADDESHDGTGVILMAGRLDPQKRPHLALDAIERLVALRTPADHPFRLDVIGEGSLSPGVKRRARDAGLPVRFLSRRPHAEVVRRMGACDVFLQVAAFEGHPKTVLEAMGMGAPTLVTATPGLADVVEHEATGLVCPSDADAVARALDRLLRSPDLRARLSDRAARATRAALSLDKIAPMEAEAHRAALDRQPDPGAPTVREPADASGTPRIGH